MEPCRYSVVHVYPAKTSCAPKKKPSYHFHEKTFYIYPASDCEIIAELEEDKTVYAQEVIWIPLIIIFVLFLL